MTPTAMAKAIELWPLDRLVPYANNARTHSPEQVAQVAASIVEFGFNNPILVDSAAGIVAGHCRLLAAQKLQLEQVPVVVLDHLTEAQKRAYILADNKLAENAGWDEELLRTELSALDDEGFNLDVIGFSEEELEQILADPAAENAGLTDEDEVPQEQERVVTVPGDLWLLGNHRLLCGDATIVADVHRVMSDGLADMVFCDPPFNVDYVGKTAKRLTIANDSLGQQFYAMLYEACANMMAVAKGAIYICMSSSELHTLYEAFVDAGGHWSTFVIWAKHHFTLGRSDYQRQYEPILYGWPREAKHYWCGARDQGDVWFIRRPAANTEHPTQKPVELVERALHNSSKTRDTIFDPFGGSGTTMIACEKTGRFARLLEVEPKYCDVAIRRWQAFTGKEAVLAGTEHTFEQVALDRADAHAA